MKKIRELSPRLNSFLKNLFRKKEPAQKAEEVKEKRRKIKKDFMKGVALSKKGVYTARVRRQATDFYLGSWDRQSAAEAALLEFRGVLRHIDRLEFFDLEPKLRGLAKKFQMCARGGGVYLRASEYMKEEREKKGEVMPWDANTPAR